jgi:hypothetical protein
VIPSFLTDLVLWAPVGSGLAAVVYALLAAWLAPRWTSHGILAATAALVLVSGEARRALSGGYAYESTPEGTGAVLTWIGGVGMDGWVMDAGFLAAIVLLSRWGAGRLAGTRRRSGALGSAITAVSVGLVWLLVLARMFVLHEASQTFLEVSRLEVALSVRGALLGIGWLVLNVACPMALVGGAVAQRSHERTHGSTVREAAVG